VKPAPGPLADVAGEVASGRQVVPWPGVDRAD
jgi:hypothetical protein